MAEWVDFAELKGRVSLEDILQHYGLLEGLKPLKGGEELVGLCPFHPERRGSFHVSTTKNAWNCFGCHRHGNILDLVAHKEEVTIREAALLIAEWFNVQSDHVDNRRFQSLAFRRGLCKQDHLQNLGGAGRLDHWVTPCGGSYGHAGARHRIPKSELAIYCTGLHWGYHHRRGRSTKSPSHQTRHYAENLSDSANRRKSP